MVDGASGAAWELLADEGVRIERRLYVLFDSELAAFAAPLGLAGMASGEVVVGDCRRRSLRMVVVNV